MISISKLSAELILLCFAPDTVAFSLNVRSLKNDNKCLNDNLLNVRWKESFHDDDKCGRT